LAKKNEQKKEPEHTNSIRQPWIPKDTGFTAITVVSIGLAIWVTVQNVRGGGQLWTGILWGIIMGASIWLVFFGMNYFHGLFNKTNRKKDK